MSLFNSICCCVGIDRDKSKGKQELQRKAPEPLKVSNTKQLKKVQTKDDNLQTSKMILKVEQTQENINSRHQHQLRERVEPRKIHTQSALVERIPEMGSRVYEDDLISEQFRSPGSRKIKMLTKQHFFILPSQPVMQFYQHQAVQIQGMLPGNDIQYY